MEVPIKEFVYPQPSLIINNMYIQILNITFGKDATFRVQLFPEGVEYIDKPLIKIVTIEGQEYLKWNSDDNYIINLICEKIGVQRKI